MTSPFEEVFLSGIMPSRDRAIAILAFCLVTVSGALAQVTNDPSVQQQPVNSTNLASSKFDEQPKKAIFPKPEMPPKLSDVITNEPSSSDIIGGTNSSGSNIGGWHWYAEGLLQKFLTCIGQNDKINNIEFHAKIRVWLDRSGRITRAEISDSSADAKIDAVLKNQVLMGMQDNEPPPSSMPMPIVATLKVAHSK